MNTTTAALLERWLWLAISLILALFAITIRWIAERPESRFREAVATWERDPRIVWIVHTLRLLYAVGLPTFVLLERGALTERGLGLVPLPLEWHDDPVRAQALWLTWARDIGRTFTLMAAGWLTFRSAERTLRRTAGTTFTVRHDLPAAFREAVYHQIHWAFYREPFVLLWGTARGAWLGLIPVTLEAALNPKRWEELRSPHDNRDLLMRISLAILSVLLYIQTQNLWLAIFADTLLSWAFGFTLTQESTTARSTAPTSLTPIARSF